MRVSIWMMAAALALGARLLRADVLDNDRNHGAGGQGQGDHPAQGGGPGQGQPQGQAEQRFPTAGAASNGPSRPARKSAPRAHAQAHRQAPRVAAPRAANPGAGGASGASANASSHIQKRPHSNLGRQTKAKAERGPTSNVPGVGVNHAAKPGLDAQRAAGRQKLASLGVRAAPRPISDRSSMVRTSPAQSRVSAPSRGPDNRAVPTRQMDLRHFSAAGGRARMDRFSSGGRMAGFGRMNTEEREPGRYYWHDDGGQRYCHYMDPWGYQWYGWYGDDDVLWVRYYGDRWWNYDADMGRWLYWDDGQWWWQDDDGGGVYVYVDGGYILD
ncbi:MAG TPA: hypothetical protein VK842_05065 [bacterium]|nr:hypothetical protein [bacterium]